MDELEKINWSNDFYSDIFSLHLDSLFSTVELENLEMNENRTVSEVEDTTNQASERVVFAEATIETNNLPVPDESSFPLTSNELVEETLKQAENKNTNRSTATWMKIWSSWAKSRNINVSIETMAPATFNLVLHFLYHRAVNLRSRPPNKQAVRFLLIRRLIQHLRCQSFIH